MGASTPKPDHTDPDHEPDLDSEAMWALAADLGEAIVTEAAACLRGAVKAWRGLSTWQRATLAGLPLGVLGMFMGKRYGGKLGAAIGGGNRAARWGCPCPPCSSGGEDCQGSS